MKKLNATFEIENDLAEHNLRQVLEGLGAKYIKTLPSTDHLKENKAYISLRAAKRKAERNLYDFTNKNR